jgi:hypothetical protein
VDDKMQEKKNGYILSRDWRHSKPVETVYLSPPLVFLQESIFV